jgi:hypothetical protein
MKPGLSFSTEALKPLDKLIYFDGFLPIIEAKIGVVKVEAITEVDKFVYQDRLSKHVENLLSFAPNTIFDFSHASEFPSALIKEINIIIRNASKTGRRIRLAAVSDDMWKYHDVPRLYSRLVPQRDSCVDDSKNSLLTELVAISPVD